MRLKSVVIEGFRGFTRKASVDLDADVILLQGANGVGKTSLLDAILWVLSGRMERFSQNGSPISLYSREGIARVELRLRDGENEVLITRATDGNRDTVRLTTDGQEVEGAAAENRISSILLPHLREGTPPSSTLSNVVTRGIYLQQDLVRQFIETDTAAERFQLIGEMIGAGAVLELQTNLEKSRLQWARNTTSVRKERLEPLEIQLQRIEDQLARLDSEPPTQSIEARGESASIFAEIVELIGKSKLSLEEAPTTSSGLDRLLKEVSVEQTRLERQLSTVKTLLQETIDFAKMRDPDEDQVNRLLNRESWVETALAECNSAVEAAIASNSRLQERQLAEQNRINRLATMARLALGNLGEFCPVCEQRHDRDATTRHLEELISASAEPVASPTAEGTLLEELNVRRNALHSELEATRALLRDARASQREDIARKSLHRTRLLDLGIVEDGNPERELQTRAVALEQLIGRVSSLQLRGESLTLSVIRIGEQRRLSQLRQERAAIQRKISEQRIEIERLDRTHGVAGKIIDALREASLDVTRKQVESIQPLFQRIYSRIDPHPTFRLTQITTAMERGRGLLRTGVSDPEHGTAIHDALPILSSSQLNSFAASLFLALNLGLPTPRLNLVMLDDPLQSLDSINLLGLVDVLRRFREHRQIIVSTHEPKLLGLLQRKLRPVRSRERMITLHFDEWTREGPEFRAITSAYDPESARVLAA